MRSKETNCWILKTTSGGSLKDDHWEQFAAEGGLAVGWTNIRVNPMQFTNKNDFKAALRRKYSENTTHAANTIYEFSRIPAHDVVIIARGYKPGQTKPVHGILTY